MILKNLYVDNFNLLQHTMYVTWIQLLFRKINVFEEKSKKGGVWV